MKAIIGRLVPVLLLSACMGGQPHLADPAVSAHEDFVAALLQSNDAAAAGNYGTADKLLADFGLLHVASSDANEALYWRALYKLDPANPTASNRDAGVLLDTYIATGAVRRRTEALSLKRIANALEARATVVTNVAAVPAAKPDQAAEHAKDEEITRLKDELSKATAELDRIKRRLAKP